MPIAEKDEIICHCLQVTESTIRRCIETDKLVSVEQVTSAYKAGGGCHSCHVLIQLFIDQSQGKRLFVETAQPRSEASKKGLFGKLLAKLKSKGLVA